MDNASLVENEAVLKNWTNEEYVPYNLRLETYVVPPVFLIIFLVGILGNGTLVFVFLRHRNLRNIPNTYIFSLAIGDLLVILTCVPFTSTVYTLESWPYGDVICKISEWTKDVSIGVSVFTLTALSAERYCAIVNPLRRHVGGKTEEKIFTLLTVLFIWVVAIVIASPSAIFSHVETRNLSESGREILVCYPFAEHYGQIYIHFIVVFKFIAFYTVPLCIIAAFYILMASHLEASAQNMPGENQGQAPQIRARKKVAKMVLAFVAMFFICFGPYHVFMLWFHLNPNAKQEYDEFWHALRIVGFCLSFINSCINPIALYFISGTFRKYYNKYLFAMCCSKQPILRRDTFYDTSTHHWGSTKTRRYSSHYDGTIVSSAKTELVHLDNT